MSKGLSDLILSKLAQIKKLLILMALILIIAWNLRRWVPKGFDVSWGEVGLLILVCLLAFASFGLIDDIKAEISWNNHKLDD